MTLQEIGEQLREVADRHGITAPELAKLVNVDRRVIYRVYAGSNVSYGVVVAVAEKLGCRLDMVLTKESEPKLERVKVHNRKRVDENEVFDWIKNFILDNGYSPTIDEIKTGVGCGLSTIKDVLYRLRYDGRIDWQKEKQRTITVRGVWPVEL